MALGTRPGRGGAPLPPATWRERLGALRNLPPFLAMVWRTSRLLTATTLVVRLVRALLPVRRCSWASSSSTRWFISRP